MVVKIQIAHKLHDIESTLHKSDAIWTSTLLISAFLESNWHQVGIHISGFCLSWV